MTKQQKQLYEETDTLRRIITDLKGRKFRLDCGHHITMGHHLGNDLTIYNDHKHPKIICSQCGY